MTPHTSYTLGTANSTESGQSMLSGIQGDMLPNQSLKLTEIAVDDFAARQYAENDMISRYVRAMNYMEPAVRRRSLAPVRYTAKTQ